jgi:peptide/nickel transport system substrate-binding protein
MKSIISLYEKMQVEPDPGRQADLYRQILDMQKKQFDILGMGLPVNGIGIYTSKLHNVPGRAYASSAPLFPGPTEVEQFSISE